MIELAGDPEIITQNVNIQIAHQVHRGYHIVDEQPHPIAGHRVQEHVIAVYSHDKGEYLMFAGVQLKLTSRTHILPCRHVVIQVDIPYRRYAPPIVQAIGEATMLCVQDMLRRINTEGLSVIDRRETSTTVEYRSKTILGPRQIPMAPDEDF